MDKLILTTLGHTWIIDLDGTIVKHNGYKMDGKDSFLPGAQEFMKNIPEKDMIILLTSRSKDCREETERFLNNNGIRYEHIIFEAPYGERIIVNDNKTSGLQMGYAVNKTRDDAIKIYIQEDDSL